MKVLCKKIIDENTGEELSKNAWLTVGKSYIVLSVTIYESGYTEYRLLADDGYTPALFKANQFELIDNTIQNNWVVNYAQGLYFELLPKNWSDINFWEKYFDTEPTTELLFQTELKKMLKQDIL